MKSAGTGSQQVDTGGQHPGREVSMWGQRNQSTERAEIKAINILL